MENKLGHVPTGSLDLFLPIDQCVTLVGWWSRPGKVIDVHRFEQIYVTEDTHHAYLFSDHGASGPSCPGEAIISSQTHVNQDGQLEVQNLDPQIQVRARILPNGALSATIEGNPDSGRVVFFGIEDERASPQRIRDRGVYVNGQRAASASSYDDLVNPNDDETTEYWVQHGVAAVEVGLSFPHFSSYNVTIDWGDKETSSNPALPNGPAWVLILSAGAASIAIVAALLLLPRGSHQHRNSSNRPRIRKKSRRHRQ